MSTTLEVLTAICEDQGREVRPGQAAAAAEIDGSDGHIALMAPTGVGKSLIAVAAAIAHGKGIIAMHSNGLISQYASEIDAWSNATDATIATLVGKSHYWCPKASPSLAGLTDAQRAFVIENGTFIGSGLEPRIYINHSVTALVSDPEDDETEEDEDTTSSPCEDCSIRRASACPLWQARDTAIASDVVITNATMLGLGLGGYVEWAKNMVDDALIVLDEGHADVEPLKSILGVQLVVRPRYRNVTEAEAEIAAEGPDETMALVVKWASDDEHKMAKHARRFMGAMKGKGRPQFDTDGRRTVLTIPADLTDVMIGRKVVAMSGTLSERNVQELGLDASLVKLEGLDVSASRVSEIAGPAWAWSKGTQAQRQAHAAWAANVAAVLADEFAKGGALMGLFVSRDDLDAVVAQLPLEASRAVLRYYSGVDRIKAIQTFKANHRNHMIVGCLAGAGTGVDLPGELLRSVVISRVPQNAPKTADQVLWREETRSQVIQSVGRSHRYDGDWGHVQVVGGFGHRKDVVEGLKELGWVIG
jgi:Rad3-related DNA helicase